MSISFRVNRQSGDYIKATVVPANRQHEPRFGVLDGVIVMLVLTAIGGLIYLLTR